MAIGLCRAAIAYDENRGKFSSLAYKCMDSEMKKYYMEVYKDSVIPQDKIVSYDIEIYKDSDDGSTLFLSDCLEDKKSNTYNIVAKKIILEEVIEELKPKEREIMILMMKGMRQQDIATKFKCPRQTINQHVKNIRNKFKGSDLFN